MICDLRNSARGHLTVWSQLISEALGAHEGCPIGDWSREETQLQSVLNSGQKRQQSPHFSSGAFGRLLGSLGENHAALSSSAGRPRSDFEIAEGGAKEEQDCRGSSSTLLVHWESQKEAKGRTSSWREELASSPTLGCDLRHRRWAATTCLCLCDCGRCLLGTKTMPFQSVAAEL